MEKLIKIVNEFVYSLEFYSISIIFLFILDATSQLDDMLNKIDRLQQNRLDDQRTNFPPQTPRLSILNEKFLDQLAKCQVRLVTCYCQ